MDNLIYLNLSKIVVDAGHQPLTIEGNNTNQIHLLGTYEITTKANEKLNLKQDDFLSVQTAGETMYITLKSLPVQHTLFNSAPQVKPTLVLPQNKNVEIRASITNYLFIQVNYKTIGLYKKAQECLSILQKRVMYL